MGQEEKDNMWRKLEGWLFNGYVREPIPIAVIALVLGFVLLVFAVMSTCEYVKLSHSTVQTEKMECTVIGYEHEKGSPIYVLSTDIGVAVHVPIDAVQNPHILDLLIIEQAVISIEYTAPTSMEYSQVSVISITDAEGMPILPRDEVLEARKEDGIEAQIILWSICLIYWVLLGCLNHILCNAQKYPRIASLLIRAPYRNF